MNSNTSILPRRQQGGHWNWRVQQLLLNRLAKLEYGVLQVSFDGGGRHVLQGEQPGPCLLYTSDAADDQGLV